MDLPSSDELNLIQDPEVGLALLAKHPGKETPEQERERQFWQAQFTYLRDWLAGDEMAVADATSCCISFDKPPPFWLGRANFELAWQCKPDAEKRRYGDMAKHFLRWQAVELVRGRCPRDPRNFTRKVDSDDVWVEAAKFVAGTYAEADDQMVRKSHALIRRAGGRWFTLSNYKREVEARERRRKENRERRCKKIN